ncbi:MAG TPA: ABC transporter ATP-binding protein, partial [Anaerolineae bacterium]|nr:ABC transporter ATP-binding protein [Anaerolineae bacterium]
NNNIIIHVRGLTKQFNGEFGVQDVSFEVPQGKIFGFIGPSGSGKTTTVRLLTGIHVPTAGEATVLGCPPTEFTQSVRAKIGYMPQLFVLYPDLSVWENLNFVASLYGLGLWRGKRLRRLLDFVELTDHRKKLVRDLSGGMQRRLSLAATLVHDPQLVFLDEPTAGIDPVLRRKVWDHFKQMQDEGRTLFVTTQYVGEAAYCDLVGVMANGRLLMVDTPEGLRRRAFGGEVVDLRTAERLSYEHVQLIRALPFVEQHEVMRTGDNSLRIIVDEASTAMPALLDWAKAQNLTIESIEEYLPPFDDVFVALVQEEPVNE